jgi:hypothetical protein
MKMMAFDLARPCAHCPVRSDRPFGLRRAGEIAEALFQADQTFACHATLHRREGQHCAGALILHEKVGRPNWRIRFAARLGLFDPARLHMEAPIFDTVADFVRVNEGG